MRLLVLIALGLVSLAAPARAVNDWGYANCQRDSTVWSTGRICFDFNSSLSPAATTFIVSGSAALACLKPDDTTAGTATAQATIYKCSYGVTSAEADCIQICPDAGCPLDGTAGTAAAQRSCIWVGPGAYRVVFDALPAGGELGIFTVEGSQ
jgi:hypothetical protein